ncbi:MAG TPA: O-antigen ligase family protein, partial [Pyrinomonadaceae bacterium]
WRRPRLSEEREDGFSVSRAGGPARDGEDFSDFRRRPPRAEDHSSPEGEEPPFGYEDADAEPLPAGKPTGRLKRAHALSFAGLFLFTVVLYFRPYELFTSLAGVRSLAFWIAVATLLAFVPSQLSAEGGLTIRPREVNLVLLLALAGLLSIPFSINREEAFGTFVEFAKVVIMFVVMVNVVRTPARLKALMFLGLAVGVLVGAGAINDYRLGNLRLQGERIQGIVGGMFDNPNDMALHLAMMTPLALALMLTSKGLLRKVLYAACALVMVLADVVTFSRGGFLGLICAAGLFMWKVGRRHRFAVIAVSLLAVLLFMAFMPGTMGERFAAVFDPTGETSSAAISAVSRRLILYRSILVALRHPLFGIGMGTFHTVSIHEQVAHNGYTQVASEMGIPAMLIYVMLILSPLKRMRAVERETVGSREDSGWYYLAVGLQACLVAYMVSSFFGSVAYLYNLYYPVGYAVCLHRMYTASREGKESAAAGGNSGGRARDTFAPPDESYGEPSIMRGRTG